MPRHIANSHLVFSGVLLFVLLILAGCKGTGHVTDSLTVRGVVVTEPKRDFQTSEVLDRIRLLDDVQPVAHAKVYLTKERAGEKITGYETETDDKGNYYIQIAGIEFGQYYIVVEAPGYERLVHEVEIYRHVPLGDGRDFMQNTCILKKIAKKE